MAKKKRETVKITFTLDKEIVDMIDKLNEKTSVPKVKIVEKAVRFYVSEETRKYNELEKKYGKLKGESFGWVDD